MDFDRHVARYNGVWIQEYGGECVANAAKYCLDNGKPIAYANAKDWWLHPALTGAFQFIANNPSDFNQVPLRGDVVIWNGGLAGSGGYGHIAIYDAKVAPGIFRSFDANWGGRPCHFVTHNYNNVQGWFRPKTPVVITGDKPMNKDEEANAYRIMLNRPMEHGGSGRTGYKFILDGEAEINAQREGMKAQLQNIQEAVNQQNVIISSLNTTNASTKAEYQKAVAELAELNNQLATAHDTIKDLESRPPQVIETIKEVEPSYITKVRDFINKFLKKGDK